MNYRNVDKKQTITITKDDVLSGDLITPAYKKEIVIDSPVTISGDVILEKKLTFKKPDLSPFYNTEKSTEKSIANLENINNKINKIENLIETINKTKIGNLEKYVDKLVKEQPNSKTVNDIENFFKKYDKTKLEKLINYNDNIDINNINNCISTKIINSVQDVNYFNIKISDKYTVKYVVYNLIVIIMSKKGRCYTNIKFFYDPVRENKNFSIISKEVAPDNYYNCSLEYTKDKILKFYFSTEKIGFDNLILSLYTNH